MPVRVRFAPSPTGMLHVGALRDSLFKFLYARHEGGANILRIEDTDRSRYNPDSEKEFIDSLHWVGIVFDEGPHVGGPHAPYRQSERKEAGIYDQWIGVLLAQGDAYKAFETPEELDEAREYQQLNKLPTGYFGGKWRDASPEDVALAESEGRPFVIRQRIPRDTAIAIEDVIRGRIEWDSNMIDDPVLIKADGMPTYHFASMVDDHLMEITHIMRGEEWISSAPKHAALFDAFGWERPIFVHCPVIVGNDGKKLSKRHGATRVLDYMAQGYLPSALKNFVALIGWSPGDDQEAMSEEDLIKAFDLKGLQPSPGRFDMDKLGWLNGHHIREMAAEKLLDAVLELAQTPTARTYWTEFVDDQPVPNQPSVDGKQVLMRLDLLVEAATRDRSYALQGILLLRERVQTLVDFGEACEFLLVDEVEFDPKAVEKWLGQPHVPELFTSLIDWLESWQTTPDVAFPGISASQLPESVSGTVIDSAPVSTGTGFVLGDPYGPTPADCESMLKGWAEAHGMEKLGPVVHPTRVALTGKTTGPGLFELMQVLGKERMILRLVRALKIAKGAE